MRKLFGTDGIRGVAGKFPLDRSTLSKIGLALAQSEFARGIKPRIMFGRDTRASGQWISASLATALESSGCVEEITDVGVISTPGLAYLTRIHNYDLGIMISASHNPYEDNGIKVFGRDGFKLSDDDEIEIEKLIEGMSQSDVSASLDRTTTERSHFVEDYVGFLALQTEPLKGLRIGLDLCNGSAYRIAPKVFHRLGADTIVINSAPDGTNINRDCGSLHLSGIRELVIREKLHFGVAYDGDADRSIFITSSGGIFDGDSAIFSLAVHSQTNSNNATKIVVGTVMSNYGLELALKERGIELLRSSVGDRYVLELMKQSGAKIGGEPSGHVILADCHTAGDGVLTSIKIAELARDCGLDLDRLTDGFRRFPQILDAIRVASKIPLDSPDVAAVIEQAEQKLGGEGRLVVRYSGTEPVLRVMAEGKSRDQIEMLVSELKTQLSSLLHA